ncbi:MAG: TonB-dependent receptor [Alphaproteobacteria bacterium]|nr:TonB-dependent receptor [Alphaproteobacteria bacterium]MBU2164791.1 TonB-dependent receptor [Alphaproteobacteria bacterium]MBU2232293.1 TonB-dependent receptor [Alphaproteobacteria bacterium]MBU2349792.1 TonB-dependent receptor [Alphaproteobacteria bacterium]MBU2400807.1 TonB-dependent receptor [Alphaproteobacteria bacterium]
MTMSQRLNRRVRLLSGAAFGAAALVAVSSAQAQTAAATTQADEQPAEVGEIVVTGIRRSIEASISAKANNTSIVEVISAEDIGKLPDVSIAESLARLPGVTMQRLDGRSQQISIRGLGPDFTTALLNGRELVTTGDNRGVEFDQFPSELLGSVVVYKTPDAALIGQGLAGTVDLRTVRPLAYGRQAIAVNYRHEWNDIGALNSGTTDSGDRYTVSYIDQFMDGTLGVALGYAHMSSPYQSERFNAWGYPNYSDGNLLTGGVKPYVMSSELERDGYMGVLEWRPNDRIHSTIDAFYSEFKNTQVLRGIEFPLAWGGLAESPGRTNTVLGGCQITNNVATPNVCRPGPSLRPGYTVEDGLIVAGTWDNIKGVVRNDLNKRDSNITALGWNTEFVANDDWTLALDVNYSKVERNDIILETNGGTGRNINGALDTLGFELTDDGVTRFTSQLDYADPTLIRITSAQGWGSDVIPGGQVGYMNTPSIEDEIKAARLTANRTLHQSPFKSIDFGVNYSERSKSFVNDQYYIGVPGGGDLFVPSEYLLAPTDLGYLGISQVLSYDALGLVNSGLLDLVRNPNADVAAGNWEVTEKVSTAYVRANIDHDLFGLPLTGNVGMQFVYTDQQGQGFEAQQISQGVAAVAKLTGGADYLEILPSSNFILEVGDDMFARFAVARTLARPRMDDMRASRNFSFNAGNNNANATPTRNSPWGGGGGNPELKPFIADVVDVSFEKYFANRKGYVSLAAFYKNLESYVYTRSVLFDFTGYPTGGVTPVINEGVLTTPENGDGGWIKGLEFSVSAPFDIFHPALEGFGGVFSASQTDSEVQPDPANPPTTLPGLSETVMNGTLYYERYGFQARVSGRYRSDFLGEVAGFGNGRTLRSVAAETVVDAQVGYEFQSGPLEGLSILAQVNNLTDEPFKTFENGDERRTIDYQSYGRTFAVGMNYRF